MYTSITHFPKTLNILKVLSFTSRSKSGTSFELIYSLLQNKFIPLKYSVCRLSRVPKIKVWPREKITLDDGCPYPLLLEIPVRFTFSYSEKKKKKLDFDIKWSKSGDCFSWLITSLQSLLFRKNLIVTNFTVLQTTNFVTHVFFLLNVEVKKDYFIFNLK